MYMSSSGRCCCTWSRRAFLFSSFRRGVASSVVRKSQAKSQASTQSNNPCQDFDWVSNFAPKFWIHGSKIDCVTDPSFFYETFKKMLSQAERRIVISSLYLGVGQKEKDLVSSIAGALSAAGARGDQLEVQVLLDCVRAHRGAENSVTLLQPLLQQFRDQMTLSLYHTPDLRGWKKRLIPPKFNEVIGVQHMKVYLVDDDLLIGGGNLSSDYFTNRQDRYLLLRDCGKIADFFAELVRCMGECSLQVAEDGDLSLHPSFPHHPYLDSDNGEGYKRASGTRVQELLARYHALTSAQESQEGDTVVYPLVQMGPLGVTADSLVTRRLWEGLGPGWQLWLASGYFNLTRQYLQSLLHHCRAGLHVLTAAPRANGFYKGGFPLSGIPHAYTKIEREFYRELTRYSSHERVKIYEAERDGWTFHVKGLWLYPPSSTLPSATVVGSPNFGFRSVHRDLEAQILVATENQELREKLEQERAGLFEGSSPVTQDLFKHPDRRIPLWVHFVTPILRNFF